MLTAFTASATTRDISPGEEKLDPKGVLRIRSRVFSDIVESDEDRIAGTNEPVLDIDLDTASGEATLKGRFLLRPKAFDASWSGELDGRISGGLVEAFGTAQGAGALMGQVLRVDFRQVLEPAGAPPCPDPKAFFEMTGFILEP